MLQTLAIFLALTGLLGGQTNQNWTHYARIAGHGLRLDNAAEIVRESTDTNVLGRTNSESFIKNQPDAGSYFST